MSGARPRRQGVSLAIEVDTLQIPATRDVPEPEPVNVSVINGREPLKWEQAEIKAARERERALEWRP